MCDDADFDIGESAVIGAILTLIKLYARELARQELHSALRESCSRGDVSRAKAILRDLGAEAEIIINSAPNGSNTLLFKACEEGQREMVRLLLDHGADGRIHPVTKYSPLYIACYYGRRDIAEMLLKKFPTLVNVSTVERWLPLHACIINGHTSVLELLLKFPYPEEALRKYWDKTGQYEYEMAFDINMKDVTGQSALYLACYVGNQKLVDLLLKHRIQATKVKTKEEIEKERQQKEMDSSSNDSKSSSRENTKTSIDSTSDLAEKSDDVASPTKHRISGGIQALMSKLNLVKTDANQKDNMISPLDIDMYCNSNTETALHIAVKNKHHSIVSMLLAAGANPNLRVYLPDDEMARLAEDEYIFTGSTALVEACRNRDLGMLDLLLKSHARDDECKALFIAAHAKDEIIVSKLLALKAHPDPEFKVNKRALEIKPSQQFSSLSVSNAGGVYSSLAPSTPVMINWHGQRCLSYLKDQWLVDASVNLNPKLRLSPRNQVIALYAITRLDISNNALTELPDMIFQLPSLKTLNAAQNKIEKLPPNIGHFIDGTVTLPRKGSKKELVIGPLSVLEEVHLQDNRLDSLPDGIFTLPALQLLDVSNNKLSSLPYKIWTAPKLRELNASLNLLHDLPVRPEGQGHDSGMSSDAVSEVSDEDSLSSASELQLSLMDDSTDESPARRKTPDHRGVLSLGKHGNVITCCRRRDLKHHSLWSNTVEIQESLVGVRETEEETMSNLQSLNLSHNSFTSVPSGLACLALSLNRLNLSYNRLSEMGAATCYPVGLKQLDLSHNRIRAWPTVSRSESLESLESTLPSCYALAEVSRSAKFACQVQTSKLHPFSFLPPHNYIGEKEEDFFCLCLASPVRSSAPRKSWLLFPNLSMLDVSNNLLRELPTTLHELTNLSVLNISGNTDITELPPEMGLLSRLWNLNTRACSLQEPLKSMIDSKKYKTMDVIGYLKSILEDARPYARMKLMIVGVQGIGKTSLLEQLRQEGTGSYRKKPVEHWAKRMGNKNINTRTSRGTSMSTVGVDIGDWIFEKKVRGHSNYGPVVFRTWDFGGQKEYYATHQYFLSKRSLYLVVWKISDGERGVAEILQWLVNIQARAPNSPVLIVGTHYDLVKEKFPPSWSEDLQQMIRDRFINVIDADKLGLPRVLDTIEVSCKTRHNIKLLCNLIYDTVFSLKTPGVMLHYEDATLKDLYFLDPQWLCDMLAHVVTIREINPFARNGIMKLDDLKHVFKSSTCAPMDAKSYIVNLLNKFEVALTWDNRTLLIPSLLPSEEQLRSGLPGMDVRVKIPVRSRGWAVRSKKFSSSTGSTIVGNSAFYMTNADVRKPARPLSYHGLTTEAIGSPKKESEEVGLTPSADPPAVQVTHRSAPHAAIRRLLLMSYFPSGFWSRLITRILADDAVVDIIRNYFVMPRESYIASLSPSYPTLGTRFVHTSEGKFLVTRLVPCPVCLECHGQHEGPGNHPQARHLPDNWGSFVEMNPLYCSMTASQISQDLNASHASLERSLLTNSLMGSLAPSQQGHPLVGVPSPQPGGRSSTSSTAAGGGGGTVGGGVSPGGAAIGGNMSPQLPRRSWGSRESYTSDGDSGVGAESTTSRYFVMNCKCRSQHLYIFNCRKPSAEGRPDLDNSGNNEGETSGGQEVTPVVYSFMVEECILAAYTARSVPCPLHADLLLAQIAPDTVFLDLGDRYLVRPELIKQGKLLGRGGFGFVFQGACRNRASGAPMDVALKMLQPVDPGTSARQSAIVAYKAAQSKWERDPLQYACKAYCSARQEVNILLSLRHPHIVPLVGVCPRPLALVLELAPQGALDQCLKHYQRSGARLSLHTLQAVVLQVAKALEYLHGQHIIYRDLKSENVLVWELPPPFHHQPQPKVDVRLADYGISRSSLPTGTKGFGGTEGFMAPEMMRHNGEEEYTEKVDCFSFGMFMYELLTTHQPYEHCDNVKEHVLEGGRPALTHRETEYPVYVLDLMVMCWSQQPRLRPSASQIVSIASAPEFTHLLDVASLDHSLNIMDAIRVPPVLVKDEDGELVVRDQGSIWVSRTSPQLDMVGAGEWGWGAYTSIEGLPDTITAMCCVGDYVWLGDSAGNIHGYSTRDYGRVFSYCLEPDAPQSSPVRSLCSLHALGRVAVALCNGRLFLCSSDVTPTSPVLGEGSFVMTELAGSTQEIHCLAVAQTPTTWSLWCGGSEGTMSIFSLRDDGLVVSQDSVSHFTTSTPPPSGDACDVLILHAPQTISAVSRHLRNSIWSYVYPGCVVYHWDVKEKKLVNRLDCSKLVPCSESLQSISIEEHLSPSQCQVSAVAVCGGEVYVGTTWGCVVVAEAESMRPITVFRPYEDEVRAIVPLPPTSVIVEPELGSGDVSDSSEGDVERLMNPVPLLATIGKGYRNLLGRYAPIPRSAQPEPGAQRAMYCLLWRAHHWLNT
ncbi:leucine-rich repeat serine/threonine-protein kinase 1-like [Penaeus indicus]|uniref:leucine-rich repeat serine/threonine-protein kinase 1-like n=1 Tax=Penaeus indicus TaxID=29960 RepID=UPI00300D2A89